MTIWNQSGRFLALALLAGVCLAQTPAEPAAKFFKLDFVIKEVEGNKVLNSRQYSTLASTEHGSNCTIRAGSKVPVLVAPGQYNYHDIGVNVDCKNLVETGSEISMNVTAEVSTLLDDSSSPSAPSAAVVRQNRWNSNITVPFRKPTVVFSSDDLTTRHQLQLEVTATPVR